MSPEIDAGEIRHLEERAFRGWPALETRDVAGWRLRFAGGYTKRANSINSLSQEAECGPETLAGLEVAYRERGLGPVWRLTSLAPAAAKGLLVSPAYRTIERSLVQVAPLHAEFAADPEVRIEARPSAPWIEAFAHHSPVAPQHRATMRRMVMAMPRAGLVARCSF